MGNSALNALFNETKFQPLAVRIVKLLTRHVVSGEFWLPTNGSPPCWWRGYLFRTFSNDWFELPLSHCLILIGLAVFIRISVSWGSSIPRKRRDEHSNHEASSELAYTAGCREVVENSLRAVGSIVFKEGKLVCKTCGTCLF